MRMYSFLGLESPMLLGESNDFLLHITGVEKIHLIFISPEVG